MPKKLFLKPANGATVFLPNRGRNIFQDGELVVVDSFVERCITEGALVNASEKMQQEPNTTKTNNKEKR